MRSRLPCVDGALLGVMRYAGDWGGLGAGFFEGFLCEVGCVGAGFWGLGARAWGVRVVIGWWRLVLLSQSLEVIMPLLLVFVGDLPDDLL